MKKMLKEIIKYTILNLSVRTFVIPFYCKYGSGSGSGSVTVPPTVPVPVPQHCFHLVGVGAAWLLFAALLLVLYWREGGRRLRYSLL